MKAMLSAIRGFKRSRLVASAFLDFVEDRSTSMAKSVSILTPNSFTELLEGIESFQVASAGSWYRGVRKAAHKLKPTLYRHKKKADIKAIAELEVEITSRFSQRAPPYLTRSLIDDWDKLFLMQHYGVPTRLLDWTENPFIAIYFALNAAVEPKSTDAAIWMCDPGAWNRAALSHLSFKGAILDQDSEEVRPYKPGAAFSTMPMLPIMMYGTYNSPRIVAQRGGFTLFGQGIEPMEEIYLADPFVDGTLTKIVIPHGKLNEMRASLFRKGITESVVFPDLEGLSKELRRVFGF